MTDQKPRTILPLINVPYETVKCYSINLSQLLVCYRRIYGSEVKTNAQYGQRYRFMVEGGPLDGVQHAVLKRIEEGRCIGAIWFDTFIKKMVIDSHVPAGEWTIVVDIGR